MIILLLLSSVSGSFCQTNVFPTSGNVGIGTASPNAKLSFNNLNDGSNGADGITWYSPDRLLYGIYRTAGPWVSPDYQQLKLSFTTGIIIDPGTDYGKSFVDVQGGGLRVSSGNVGIGTNSAPAYKLDVQGPANDWKARFQGPDGYITIGPINSGFAHIYTDRPQFIFNKNIWSYYGGFSSYNTSDLFLQTNGTTRLTVLHANGNVGIGTASPNEKLTVNGTIYGKEVKVDLSVPGPDYVFEDEYRLPSLEYTRKYIEQHRHLPGVPSAKEMAEDGVDLGEMNMILLKKVEELTLYMIELNRENKEIKKQLKMK